MIQDVAVDYRIPGGNAISLTDELAAQIRSRMNADRENRFQLYLLAAGLRKKYKGKSLQGDKKASGFSSEFDDWYRKHKLDDLIGSPSNFSKYASSGEVVAHVAANTSDREKYLKQLPTGVGVLYEISQILRKSPEAFPLCLQFTARRKSLTSPRHEWSTSTPPLINPRVTELAVRKWHREWLEPPPPKTQRTDKRTLPLATITVSGELFDFNRKTGDKVGCVDLPDVQVFLRKLKALFGASNEAQFRLEDSFDYLESGYVRRREQADPANKILNRQSKKATKAAPRKMRG